MINNNNTIGRRAVRPKLITRLKQCRRCNEFYRTHGKYSKICPECNLVHKVKTPNPQTVPRVQFEYKK